MAQDAKEAIADLKERKEKAKQPNAKEIKIFLNAVAWGRQSKVETLLKKNKDLAFAAGDVIDPAKRTFKNITGFQYAVWALDWKMWAALQQAIPIDALIEQAKGFKEGSWVKEHGEHATWKELTDALQVYADNYHWSERTLAKHWVEQVGAAQFSLPIHVLQEYCNPGKPFNFDPCPNFSNDYKLTRSFPDWLSAGLDKEKFDFGILRHNYEGPNGLRKADVGEWIVTSVMAGSERSALISLYNARTQQRDELVASLLKVSNSRLSISDSLTGRVKALNLSAEKAETKETKDRSDISTPYIPQRQIQKTTISIQTKVDEKEVQTFLNAVVWGRQPEVETLLKKNKDLALAAGDVTDPATRSFKNITGFQYVVWALDWQLWTVFMNYLPKEAAIEQAKGFKTGSWVKEHGEHATWKKLLDALQVFRANFFGHTEKQFKQRWIEQVGGAQFSLPVHVLQEYCNPDRPFSPCPAFSACSIQYTLERSLPDWLSSGISKKRFDFALVRVDLDRWDMLKLPDIAWRWCLSSSIDDRLALTSLYDTRIEQRDELVATLLSNDVRQAQKTNRK